MNIQEVKEEKVKLKKDISELLVRFCESTGIDIMCVDARVEPIYSETMDGNRYYAGNNYNVDVRIGL